MSRSPVSGRWAGRRWAHLGLGLVGLLALGWALLWGANPQITCRDQVMGPGDTCEYSSLTNERGGKVQRYEDRIAVAREQAPFAVAAGLGMVAFGAVLARRPAVTEPETSGRR